MKTMKTMECKLCGKKISGLPWQMSAHVRTDCPKTIRNGVGAGADAESPFDAIRVIDSLNAATIRDQINRTEQQLRASKALLIVAETNEVHEV